MPSSVGPLPLFLLWSPPVLPCQVSLQHLSLKALVAPAFVLSDPAVGNCPLPSAFLPSLPTTHTLTHTHTHTHTQKHSHWPRVCTAALGSLLRLSVQPQLLLQRLPHLPPRPTEESGSGQISPSLPLERTKDTGLLGDFYIMVHSASPQKSSAPRFPHVDCLDLKPKCGKPGTPLPQALPAQDFGDSI